VRAVSPIFGGINLEDISAPALLRDRGSLRKELDIPVFHDDQHGTGGRSVLASLINALKVVKKKMSDVRVVFAGAGASGIATAKLLMAVGCRTSSAAIGRAPSTPAGVRT
jgi:malate dehydrogenase (oxaloacetate-decarboxylating)